MDNQVVAIYPYSAEFAPFLRYLKRHRSNNYRLVSPRGLGLEGQDAGEADRGDMIGIIVECDLDGAIEAANRLLLVPSHDVTDQTIEKMKEAAMKAILSGKPVELAAKLPDSFIEELQTKAKANNVPIAAYSNDAVLYQKQPRISIQNILYSQQSTVLSVGSVLSGIDTTDFILKLKDLLSSENYLVNTILNKHYANLLGSDFHPIPSYIGCTGETARQIIEFNHYVESLEKNHRSDIILIQYPGGMQKYDNDVCGDLGIYSYLVAQAVIPDYFILVSPYWNFAPDYWERLSEAFTYRFNSPIHAVMLTNKAFDGARSKEEKNVVYSTVPVTRVNEKIKDYQKLNRSVPLYNIKDDNSIQLALKDMLGVMKTYNIHM